MDELRIIYEMLVSILGHPKTPPEARAFIRCNETIQLQFGCPECIERKGPQEVAKKNLEVCLINKTNPSKSGVFRCWSCESEGIQTSGSILKLFRLYGGKDMEKRCADLLRQMRNNDMYKLSFGSHLDGEILATEDIKLPYPMKFIDDYDRMPNCIAKYLKGRGVTWKMIQRWKIGYTAYVDENRSYSDRIIIPSFQNGLLNYWTGRDYMGYSKQKYMNCKADRKSVVFGYDNIVWDGDLIICEGPFDAISLPFGQAIPMLGKVIKPGFRLYDELYKRFNGNTITLFFDGDVNPYYIKETYRNLNHDRLHGKIRYIPLSDKRLDASLIYQTWGEKGILNVLKSATTINEAWL